MRRPSFKAQLTGWYGLILSCTLLGLGAAVYLLMERALLARVDAALDFEFQETGERLRTGRLGMEIPAIPSAFQHTYLLRVLDSRGNVVVDDSSLAKYQASAQLHPVGGETRYHRSMDFGAFGPHRIVAGELRDKRDLWTIQIATSLEAVHGELRELSHVLLMILPAGLVAATLCGYLLAGRFLTPLGRMTEAARRISAQNLDERLDVSTQADELGRLAETINAMLDRIKDSFAATQQFTADAAHELRTPLALIRTEAEVALVTRRSGEEYEQVLQSIVEEAERLALLSDRLLMLSREDTASALANPQVMQLGEIMALAVDETRTDAERAGVAIRVEGLPDLPVLGDRDLLRQVFRNLLDNAVKYSRAGGEIVVQGRSVDGMALLEVADTGIGMPEEALPRIFDRFYRVDSSRDRRTGGTGLGLSIAKAVVARHGGGLEVESALGKGSTFRVLLPKHMDST